MVRILLMAAFVSACVATPPQQQPNEPNAAYIEIVGNYHGRNLELRLNSAVVASGRQHLLPEGVAWRENLPNTAHITLDLNIEPCAPYQVEFNAAGATPTLIIRDCAFEFVR